MVKRKEQIDNATAVLAQELSTITEFTEQQIVRLHKDFVCRAGAKGFLTEQDFALTLQVLDEICLSTLSHFLSQLG